MANHGYFGIDIDGELKEDKTDVAIDELKNSYKIYQEKRPKKCFYCKGRFDIMNTHNIRICQNKFLHGKSKFATWLGGQFKMMHFQVNINNSLEETYASIINSTLKCEEIIIKDTPDLNSRNI
jgi:hypothetical protein